MIIFDLSAMKDFAGCLNLIEIENQCATGFFFVNVGGDDLILIR